MNKNNELNILRILKWAPISFIIILSIIVTYLKVIDNKVTLKNSLTIVKDEFIQRNNNRIMSEVDSIYTYIKYQKKISENRLKEILKNRVYEAHTLANNIYNENKNKNKKEIIKLIKDALRDFRFNNNRTYYLLTSKKGHALLYPIKREVEGKNFSHLKDINGFYFIKKIMEIIENKNEDFSEYYLKKLDTNSLKIHKKIMFSKYFKPLNIAISASDYTKDYEKTTKKNVLKYINTLAKNEKSYFFIFNDEGKMLSHLNQDYINVDLKNLPLGIKIVINNMKKSIKKGKFFLKYINNFDIKSTFNGIEKTSYIRPFKAWNWNIGKGYYNIELEKLIEKKKNIFIHNSEEKLRIIILISIISTTLLLLISFYLSKLVQKRFLSYKQELLKEIQKNKEKEALLSQQSKMAAMGEMIANIAHQWRQPLSVISTASTGMRLKKEFKNLSDKDFYYTLDAIDNTLSYLSKTINDFTNFFKTDKNRILITSNKIWHNIYSLLKVQFDEHNIKFILDIKDVKLSILPNELAQVLINVLNNSKDQFLHEKLEKRIIFINMYEEKDLFVIKIIDNANGVKEDILQRIFEPYFTTKHKFQGTGIGLYMCSEIVKRSLKGNISADNISYFYKEIKYTGLLTTIKIPKNII